MNRQWLLEERSGQHTLPQAAAASTAAVGASGRAARELHSLNQPQCLAYTCRGASLKNSGAATRLRWNGRSAHRLPPEPASVPTNETGVADRHRGCHADSVLGAAEPPPTAQGQLRAAVSNSTGKDCALSLWNGLGGDLDGLSELEAMACTRQSSDARAPFRRCLSQIAPCPQQLPVAVGAPTRYRCSAAGRRSVCSFVP